MQAFHLYVLLGKKIFPDIARQKTAALLDQFQPGLVSRLMNYEVVEGKKRTITGFPPVQFAHNQDGFSLVGFGETGSALLADISAPLATAWSDHLDVPVKLDSKVVQLQLGMEQVKSVSKVVQLQLVMKQDKPDKINIVSLLVIMLVKPDKVIKV